MADSADKHRRGPTRLSELVGRVLDPVTRRRGFQTADLIAAWPEIVGKRYAECTRPERIAWPRGEDKAEGGVLHLRVDGPRAVLIQHEIGQITERVNAFLGYGAISRIRLVQAPVAARQAGGGAEPHLGAEAEQRLGAMVSGAEDDRLKAALDRLGRGVLSGR